MIEDDLKALCKMTLPEVKQVFGSYFNCKPPKRSRNFFINTIGYRMQELAYGGLSMETKNFLIREDISAPVPKKKLIAPVGTIIIKNYKGTDFHIRVLENGFDLNGQHYKSLSGVAKKITGMKISGKRFLGFKERK